MSAANHGLPIARDLGVMRGDRMGGTTARVSLFLFALLFGLPLVRGDDPAPGRSRDPATPPDLHIGPATPPGGAGPAAWVGPIHAAFDPDRALEHVAFVDRFHREPGNPGFEAVLDRVIRTLRAAGFSEEGERTLEIVETRECEGWSPVRARLTHLGEERKGEDEVLLAFDADDDRHRTMLPTGARGGVVEGRVVFSTEAVEPGTILVTGEPMTMAAARAHRRGALAVLGIRLESYHQDPAGGDRHLDAIVYSRVRGSTPLPVGRISMRVHDRLRALATDGPVRVRWEAEVARSPRKLRTVIATITGAIEPDRVVAIAGHVQEPGAVDNASGVGGLLEAAVTVSALIEAGTLPRPARSVAFIWGNEMEQSRVYLDHLGREGSTRTALAAISADMIGASRAATGAWPLLERDPDPGAIELLPPDAHTPWGAARVRRDSIRPNGLSLVARLALRDVARAVGGWETREHPYEGGSDHDIFLREGTPAILFWCFTDFAYHTSLDRLSHVDPVVMRRLATAIVATAWSLAHPGPEDLPRYREALALDRELRLGAARGAEREELAAMWEEWFAGAADWLERECRPPTSAAEPDDR